MAEKKSVFSKALGIFVEVDGDHDEPTETSGTSAADEIAAIAQGVGVKGAGAAPAAAHGAPGAPALPPLKVPAGPVAADIDAFFKSVGVDPDEIDRVKKAEELLKSLPAETPTAVKKQIVEASLKAFGFDVAKIVGAANNQKRALDAYVKAQETSTRTVNTEAEAKIESFNKQIATLKAEIEKRSATLTQQSQLAQARKEQVQKILDFFAASQGA